MSAGGLVIPALAFDDAKATIFNDAQSAAHSNTTLYLGIYEFRKTNQEEDLLFKISCLDINKLVVSTASSNGVSFERSIAPACELVLPFNGEGMVESNGSSTRFQANENAVFHSYQQKKQTARGSGLTVNLNSKRLDETCAALLGPEHKQIISSNPQSPSLHVGDISFSVLFRSLCFQIDATGANPHLLQKLALDDSFYRLCVGLLHPNLFLADDAHDGKRPYVRPEITKLCEFLCAHLNEPISLTQMEQMSGLSARVLQRSFQKAFDLRPKQWVRKQRLHAARSAMLKAQEPTTITAVAYDFCFASPSDFARHYLAEFGEPPSQTLMRK